MANKKRKKKLSRRQRREQGAAAPAASNPAANVPEPEAEPLTGDQPEVEAAEQQAVRATFTPSSTAGNHGVDAEIERVEYPAVRRDLRKLGITIVVLILVIVGLTIWNDHSNVVGEVGEWLFSFWQ